MKRTMGTGKVAAFAAFCLGAAAAFAYDCPNALVEYVEADGVSQYADTGVTGAMGVKMEAVMEWTELPNDAVFIGSRTGNARFFLYNCYASSYNHRLSYGAELKPAIKNGSAPAAAANVKYKIVSLLEDGAQQMTVSEANGDDWEDIGAVNVADSSSVDTGLSMYLFARNYNDGTADSFAKARVYSLKLWQKVNGAYTLVRDYQPCISAGRPALWDKVNGTITFAAGTGDFTSGARIPFEPDAYLNYIQATGTQYIDTGVAPSVGLKVRADMNWTSLGSSGAWHDWSLIGSKGSSNASRFYMIHLNHYNTTIPAICFGYGAFYRTRTSPFSTRHEVVSDFSDSSALQIYANGEMTVSLDQQAACAAATVDVPSQYPLYLFAMNNLGSASNFAQANVYGLKIFKKDDGTGEFELIRHYLPCVKCGKAGLYDKVNGTISFSQGADDFVAGDILARPCELVEWIESDPDTSVNSYIDTQVIGKSGVKSEVDCSIMGGFAADQAILACRSKGSGSARFFPAYFYGGYFGYGYISGYWGSGSAIEQVAPTNNVSYANDTRYRIVSDLSRGAQSVKISTNGGAEVELVKSSYGHDDTYFTTTNTLTFFALHDANPDGYGCRSHIRLYAAKIWDGDELLRDYVPCVDDAGEAGLYDRVTERVFKSPTAYNLATKVGGCTNSPVIAEGAKPQYKLEYIEADGVQDFFDTGVLGNDGVKMETVMEWVEVPADAVFVGSRKPNVIVDSATTNEFRFYTYNYWLNPNGNISSHRFSYGPDIWSAMNGEAAPSATAGVKYKIESTLENGAQTMSVSAENAGAWEEVASASHDKTYGIETALPMYLFACDLDGVARYFSKARVYSLKLYVKNGGGEYELVRDFVPVRMYEKAMLYDNVEGEFYRNRGRYLATGGGAAKVWQSALLLIFK